MKSRFFLSTFFLLHFSFFGLVAQENLAAKNWLNFSKKYISSFKNRSQENADAIYWQQQVNYNINVRLDDENHQLHGNIEIEYINNSPDTLDFIWFHLWPNAYKDQTTAFAKQQLENGDTEFYFSKKGVRGYIDSLNFFSGGKSLRWEFDSANIDIAKVFLNELLLPDHSLKISTPFHVKIPESFSRLGHVGQSYQITQWYPKPAVYDKNGWHPLPYLDQGEFYSAFGNFDVRITLPKNYVVGASGNLQNEDELKWLDSIAKATVKKNSFPKKKDFPPSDSLEKTLYYKIENAHDFAWFADKRFHVLKGKVTLSNSAREVTTWTMFTNQQAKLWKKAPEYLHDAVLYYSKWIGDYEYDNVTAVEGALSAGGGMEYPSVTIIGFANSDISLETVIMHEVGHNWFYGFLATNERLHPWMDEGINSFYEMRYLYTKYPDLYFLPGLKSKGLRKFLGFDFGMKFQNELLYHFNAKRNLDQPAALPAHDFTQMNYFTIVYAKTALAFEHLKSYLGDSLFDAAMQQYFQEWKFKHPQPEDLRSIFEEVSQKDLNWFFDEVIATTKKIDYKISSVKKDAENEIHTIEIKNSGEIAAPISVSALRNDRVQKTLWLNGFADEKEIQIINDNYTDYRIDAAESTLDFKRKNNSSRIRGALHQMERLQLQPFGSISDPYKTQLFFLPIIGWNNYDKTLVGFAFYNHFLPFKKFQFELAPLLGTASVQLAGTARVAYTFFIPDKKIHNITLSLYGKRFSYELFPDVLQYSKLEPQLKFEFSKKYPRSKIEKWLSFRSVNVWQQIQDFDFSESIYKIKTEKYFVNEASFEFKNKRPIYPFDFNISVQQGKSFVHTFGEFNSLVNYNKKNKGLYVRIFAGGFIWNNNENAELPDARFRLNYSTGSGIFQKDFLFDEYFFGRNETDGILSQQIFEKEGGFRAPATMQTDKWIASVNLTSTIPGRIPIMPYITAAIYQNTVGKNEKTPVLAAFEAGISIVPFPDFFEINLPLYAVVQVVENTTRKWYPGIEKNYSENLYIGKKYWSIITFKLDIKKLHPQKLMENL